MFLRRTGAVSALVISVLIFILMLNAMPKSSAKELDFVSASEFYVKGETLKNVLSYQQEGNTLNLLLQDGKIVKVSFVSPSVVRVRFNKDGNYAADNSYAVIKQDFGAVDYRVEDTGDKINLISSVLRVEINKNPYGITVYNKNNVAVNKDAQNGINWSDEGIINKKTLHPGSKFYGFGEKTGPLAKNGLALTMWNTDAFKYHETTDPLYISIPFFIETNPEYVVGTFFDNTYQTYFDLGRTKADEYYFGAQDGEINYYVIYGNNVKDVITQYTELTGRSLMPPKWALGYQQSRYSYYPDSKVIKLAKTFREKKIPCDVLYLDIDFMDGYKSFTWNKNYFKDPAGLTAKLHSQGFKVITIIDPGIKVEPGYFVYDSGLKGDHFVKEPSGQYTTGTVWPGECVFPDFTKPETRKWWGGLYKGLINFGIDAFWNDMNEPAVFNRTKTMALDALHYDFGQKSQHAKIHNVYGLEMVRATAEGLNELRPDNRNYVLSRSGYAGLQRYAAVWTGDNTANWEHLRLNIPMVLNLGLSGVPLAGADIGGYTGTPSPELLTRWMQLGAFLPVYRNHTEKDTADQEPWAFGKEAENASRIAVELRYKLIQYLYDYIREAHVLGIPVVRPLFMEFFQDQRTYDIEDQFMFGESILVAPVVKEGAREREVYLPTGSDWYDYWTGEKYVGGAVYTVKAPLDVVPVFIKAGAVIPIKDVVQYIGEKPDDLTTFLVYPGQNSKHIFYQDDGQTIEYTKGRYKEVAIEHTTGANKQAVRFNIVNDGYKSQEKFYYVKFMDVEQPEGVQVNGMDIKALADQNSLYEAKEGAHYYDSKQKALIIKVYGTDKDIDVEVMW